MEVDVLVVRGVVMGRAEFKMGRAAAVLNQMDKAVADKKGKGAEDGTSVCRAEPFLKVTQGQRDTFLAHSRRKGTEDKQTHRRGFHVVREHAGGEFVVGHHEECEE